MKDIPVDLISCIIMLLLLSSISCILLKRIRFPYTIGLVVIGVVIGVLANRYDWLGPVIGNVHLTPNIILYILLPTLVFEAAVNIDSRLLLKNLVPVVTLAAPGLVLATAVTGILVAWLTPLTLGPAMLFGGLISATDPVAVIAVFKDLGAPKRLTMLVDGESLFNDATAIVMFDIILGMLVSGAAFSVMTAANAGVQFVFVFMGGALVGALIGYVMVQFLSWAKDEPLIEIAFTTVIAYAAFIVAQFYLNLSGVMAVVGAGLVVSYYGSTRFTPKVKEYISQFWEFASFAANSYIFLLLGLTENYLSRTSEHVTRVIMYAGVTLLIVTFARILVVYGMVPLINRFSKGHRIKLPYQTIMFWGGLRGALPIGLAMSLTAAQVGGEENRIMILDFTLAVVLFTLIVQGTTISKVMHWLKMDRFSVLDDLELRSTLLKARNNGVAALAQIEKDWPVLPHEVLDHVQMDLNQLIAQSESEGEREDGMLPEQMSDEMFWIQAISVANRAIRRTFDMGFTPESVLRELEHFLDLCRDDVKHGVIPPHHVSIRNMPEEVFNRVAVTFLDAVSPGSAYARQMLFRKLALEYAVNLAVTEAYRVLVDSLAHIAELSGVGEDSLDVCRTYFAALNSRALESIERLSDEYPDEIKIMQERSVRHLVLVAENKIVEEITENGGISNKVSVLIQDELRAKCVDIENRTDFTGSI